MLAAPQQLFHPPVPLLLGDRRPWHVARGPCGGAAPQPGVRVIFLTVPGPHHQASHWQSDLHAGPLGL